MISSTESIMRRPTDAYREGYEKGRADNLAGHVSEAIFGMMRDDPGGYYAAGYSDGAAGKPFNPHGQKERKPRSEEPSAGSSATDLEKQWYRLCNSSDFIPEEIVEHYTAALRAEGSHAAIVVGLSDFTGYTCPHCPARGQFKIHFLGSLKHASCGWSGYMKTGSYIGHQIAQIAQIYHTGIRAGGAMKEEADKKPDRRGNWIYAIFGFLFVSVFRAAAAVVLIPLHCAVALFQPDQNQSDRVTRGIVLGLFLVAFGFGVYTMQQASKPQFRASQQYFPPQRVGVTPTPATQLTHTTGSAQTR